MGLSIDLKLYKKVKISLSIWLYKTTMQCLLNEVHQSFISSKRLLYQNPVVFK